METAHEPVGVVRFGIFEVDLRAAELRKQGIRIKLQEQPFQILSLLIERQGDVVTREELRHRLWPDHTFVDFDRSLNKAMTKLRFALGDSAESPRYIETLYRRGYRLLAPVTFHAERPRPHSSAAAHPYAEEAVSHDPHVSATVVSDHPRRPGLVFGIAASVLLVAGAAFYLSPSRTTIFGAFASRASRRSVAVLGFQNLSQDPHEAWLSTALSEWLTTELSAGDQLRTIPAESVARMHIELSLPNAAIFEPASLERIRKDLGTDLVVAGSYATLNAASGDQIRVDIRLQDTQTGETLDALSETGTESNLFELVSRAGQELRSRLGVRAVTREEEAAVAVELPSNPDAARLYSEGLERLRDFDALAARDLLQKAIAAEPGFALSHAALAAAWQNLGYDQSAGAEAKQAFDLSSKLSRGNRLLVEGRYHAASRDWEKAIEIYRALFEFFPDNLDYGLALADAQVSGEKGSDALATIETLRRLPAPVRNDPRIDLAEGHAAESQGDYRRSFLCSTRAAEKARASGASLLRAHALLDQAWAAENLGDFGNVSPAIEEARNIASAAHDQAVVATATTTEAIFLQNEGNFGGAKQRYEQALALDQKIGYLKGVAAGFDDLGDAFLFLGDVATSRKSYEDSVATYKKIGHQDGIGLADTGLGDVLLVTGHPSDAAHKYSEALEICRALGDRSKAAAALLGLGRAQRAMGDLSAAVRTESEAKADYESIGDTLNIARSELNLGRLELDNQQLTEAAAAAKTAAGQFESLRSLADAGNAYVLLSEIVLAQNNVAEARRMIAMAGQAVQSSHQRELSLLAEIGAARVQAYSAKAPDVAASEAKLAQAIDEASRSGFAVAALEARLALAALQLNSQSHAAGIAALRALQLDAARSGLVLIAQKAAALQTGRAAVASTEYSSRPE